MLLPSNLNLKIAEIIEGDSLFKDFSVQMHSGDGNWIALLDMREWVHIELTYKDGRVFAKASIIVLGFSGVVESHEWCMPNEMLFRSIMQLLTIAEFLPRKDNINDHEHVVHFRWMKEKRAEREACISKIRNELREDIHNYEDLLCLVFKYNLNPKNEVVLWVDRTRYINRAARAMYAEIREQSEEL